MIATLVWRPFARSFGRSMPGSISTPLPRRISPMACAVSRSWMPCISRRNRDEQSCSREGATMICVIHAHPYPSRSRINRALADALRDLPALDLRSLYALYPDFDIDVIAEQKALANAQL